MPYSDPEKRRAYLKSYREIHKSRQNNEEKDEEIRPRNILSNQWATGHSDTAKCLGCGRSITSRPTDACAEHGHLSFYNARRIRNNTYRKERRAAARANGTVYRGGRGNIENKIGKAREKDSESREILFKRLGSETCVRCGFSDKRALAFDHKNGGGAEHRRTIGAGSKYWRALLSLPVEELRSLFQVLCINCNWIKYIEEFIYARKNSKKES